MNYETVIGLEVHAQLLTRSKLFCSCSTEFGKSPNENTCPVCLGLPGVLPVLNRCAVEFAIRAGLATGCRIEPKSVFARKNYFYPDLPKGYQISQYELPVCLQGEVVVECDGQEKRIGLTRIHMEEDAGKLVHEHPERRSQEASWVDFNRGGVPLLEIVSEPDMRSPQEAVAYLKKLRTILVYLEICDGNMEEGSLRCDANVSIRAVGEKKFGTKVELKNMNSFRHVERALQYETLRQTKVLQEKGTIVQETRLWDVDREETQSMRGKEEAHDYRYFPDPDLLPLVLDAAWIEEIRGSLPELPDAKKRRFETQHGLPEADAEVLTQSKGIADFYEDCVRASVEFTSREHEGVGGMGPAPAEGGWGSVPPAKKVANWVINEFLRMIKGDEALIPESPLKPVHVAKALGLVDAGMISGSVAKTVLQKVYETGRPPEEIVEKEGLIQISDTGELEKVIDEVIAASPKEVERYKAGNEKLIGHFVGQVMKRTQGRANPAKVNELVKKKLS